jgi:hypothetical protein
MQIFESGQCTLRKVSNQISILLTINAGIRTSYRPQLMLGTVKEDDRRRCAQICDEVLYYDLDKSR